MPLSYPTQIKSCYVLLTSAAMTPEERFERIESILLQNTSQIATFLEAQVKTEHRINELQAAQLKTQEQWDERMKELQAAQLRTQEQLDAFAHDTRASIEDLAQFGMETFELVAENSTYIRGLQIENRRILRELRDRRRDDER